jgi:hypothetical protein
MTKLWNWLGKHVWPWSRLRRAEHIALEAIRYVQYRDMNEMYQKYDLFLFRELGKDRVMELVRKFNSEIEAQYGFDGALGRPDKDSAVFPSKGTGEIDPGLGAMGQALATAAKEQQDQWEKR